MLGKVFDRFIKKAPAAVMVHGVLERISSPAAFDALFSGNTVMQYTGELLFSGVLGLMNLVVCDSCPNVAGGRRHSLLIEENWVFQE